MSQLRVGVRSWRTTTTPNVPEIAISTLGFYFSECDVLFGRISSTHYLADLCASWTMAVVATSSHHLLTQHMFALRRSDTSLVFLASVECYFS